jgi:long-subunit acyl-CoA synthetase (AMP-forming)
VNELKYFINDSNTNLILYSPIASHDHSTDVTMSHFDIPMIKVDDYDLSETNRNVQFHDYHSDVIMKEDDKDALIIYTSGTTGPYTITASLLLVIINS